MTTVLVGDVGGTNSRFGLAYKQDGKICIKAFKKLPNDSFECFDDALSQYLSDVDLNTNNLAAVFALAGPPKNGSVVLTNRNWTVSSLKLRQAFQFASVTLVNDFMAMARAVPELPKEKFELISAGTAIESRPIIVAGPGTGFGVATLTPIAANGWHVMNGEGGHMAYAPQTPTERKLAERLHDLHGYVSTELICAGVGLEQVHRALCEIFGRQYETLQPGQMLAKADSGDRMFLELYRIRARGAMRAAGDLVLANGALGGAILAGGVSERLMPYLSEPESVESFRKRSKNSHYLDDCPIHLMRDPEAPLVGAAALYLEEKK